MTSGRKHSLGMTAAELMAELAGNREFQEASAARDAELLAKSKQWREAEKPIVDDLHAAGVDVASVWDLVNTAEPYPDALPVLLEHLERDDYPDRVMEGVARALAVKPAGVYWGRLRDVYLHSYGPDTREGVAAALAVSAGSEHFDELVMLLSDDSLGVSRIHFVRAVLRVGGVQGRRVLEHLRSDPTLGLEAIAALSASSST